MVSAGIPGTSNFPGIPGFFGHFPEFPGKRGRESRDFPGNPGKIGIFRIPVSREFTDPGKSTPLVVSINLNSVCSEPEVKTIMLRSVGLTVVLAAAAWSLALPPMKPDTLG